MTVLGTWRRFTVPSGAADATKSTTKRLNRERGLTRFCPYTSDHRRVLIDRS